MVPSFVSAVAWRISDNGLYDQYHLFGRNTLNSEWPDFSFYVQMNVELNHLMLSMENADFSAEYRETKNVKESSAQKKKKSEEADSLRELGRLEMEIKDKTRSDQAQLMLKVAIRSLKLVITLADSMNQFYMNISRQDYTSLSLLWQKQLYQVCVLDANTSVNTAQKELHGRDDMEKLRQILCLLELMETQEEIAIKQMLFCEELVEGLAQQVETMYFTKVHELALKDSMKEGGNLLKKSVNVRLYNDGMSVGTWRLNYSPRTTKLADLKNLFEAWFWRKMKSLNGVVLIHSVFVDANMEPMKDGPISNVEEVIVRVWETDSSIRLGNPKTGQSRGTLKQKQALVESHRPNLVKSFIKECLAIVRRNNRAINEVAADGDVQLSEGRRQNSLPSFRCCLWRRP